MITLFRRIRPKLIDSGSVTKYLLYASGEILLVVIGILIALQVNNWNETNKMHKQINSTLVEIREDLAQDQMELESMITILEADLAAQRNIINTLEQKADFTAQTHKDLGRVMLLRRTVLNENGYSLLKELGISELKSKELRNMIVDYYERKTQEVLSEIADDKVEFENTWIEYVRKNFKNWKFGELAVPNNEDEIRKGNYFLTMMRINLYNRESTLEAHKEALSANLLLKESIESRLSQ